MILALDDQLGRFQIILNRTQLDWRRLDQDDAGTRVDDHVAAIEIADNGRQGRAQILPEIVIGGGLHPGAVNGTLLRVAARATAGPARSLAAGGRTGRRVAGGRRTAGHPHVARPLTPVGQVIDLENPGLDGVRLHGNPLALYPVIVAIDIAQGIEGLANGGVLQVQADRSRQLGRKQHAVGGAGNQRIEHLGHRRVVHRQVETRLGLGCRRLIQLQRRHHGLAEGIALGLGLAGGCGSQRLVGVLEYITAPGMLIAAPGQQNCRHHHDQNLAHGRPFIDPAFPVLPEAGVTTIHFSTSGVR
jgi:hypothetical protein